MSVYDLLLFVSFTATPTRRRAAARYRVGVVDDDLRSKYNSPIEDMRIKTAFITVHVSVRISLELYGHWRRIAFGKRLPVRGLVRT
jgi:hypothetical protein